MSICQNCIHYEPPTEDDDRESCNIIGEYAAYQMGLSPCWALTGLIDSNQIRSCDCFAKKEKTNVIFRRTFARVQKRGKD